MSFVVFEGVDGAGKSTQAFLLKTHLEAKGYEVYLTKEPTDEIIGSLIRKALQGKLKTDTNTLALLFAADRMFHTENMIKRLLDNGVIVISDRYRLSSYAYQSLEVDLEWVKKINEKSLSADVTFVLDVPAFICMRRLKKQRFHFELYENEEKLEKVREKFIELAKEEKCAFIIDGNRPKEIVSEEIFQYLIEYQQKI